MTPSKPLTPFRDIRLAATAGVAALAVGLGTVGVWATTAPLAGAVIASGQIVVESSVRRIQHPTGGVVAEILVDDGDRVKAGDVLIRLDETTARANLAIIDIQYHQMLARKARLEAERDGLSDVVMPVDLTRRAGEPDIARLLEGELTIFRSRREAMEGQVSQLNERITQIGEEIGGLEAQTVSTRDQLALIKEELEGVRELYEKDLLPLSRLTVLEREAAQLSGDEGNFIAETARAKGRIAEIKLQILQLGQDLRRDVAAELRDVDAKIADLRERRIAALDQLERIELRAPQDGIVHQKAVHTIGGVIGAGDQIMLIVPQEDGLVIDAMIEPRMIDRLRIDQPVTLRFPAFDAATTPDLSGSLVRISADLTHNPDSGQSYYLARIALAEPELRKLGGKTLVPGMPVEAFIQTGERTALAYLLKPLEDQLARSFRYD